MGRVLRKGNIANKQAILYEVVAEDTSEERTSARRRGVEKSNVDAQAASQRVPQRRKGHEGKKQKRGHLQVVYGTGKEKSAKAAEQLEINYSTKRNEEPPDIL